MTAAEVFYRVSQHARGAVRRLRTTVPSVRGPSLLPVLPKSYDVTFFDMRLTWPNQIDWHRDYSSGTVAPFVFYGEIDYRDESQVGDSKYTWELNRHQFIVPWALEYASTKDEDTALAIVSLLQDWIRANPPGIGINWTSSLEMAIRILNWGIALDLCAESGHVARARLEIEEAVSKQAEFIRHTLSRFSSANNHLMGELVGLLAAAAFFPGASRVSEYGAYARGEFLRESIKQNFADGVNREQAIFYHHYTLEYMLVGMELLGRLGAPVDSELADLARKMTFFLDRMVDGRGVPFEVGDRDDGVVTGLNAGTSVSPFESLLWSGWVKFRDGSFGSHAASIALQHGREPVPDRRTQYWHGNSCEKINMNWRPGRSFFPEGGYFLAFDEGYRLMFKGGPFGYPSIAAHSHCDQLSVLLEQDQRVILTDSGTGVYHTDEKWRRYFKGTSAHNTVSVDGLDQAEYAGPFLWATHADGTLRIVNDTPSYYCVHGEHAGYRRLPDPVEHRRTLEWRQGVGYRVVDELSGHDRHQYVLFWNFAPGLALEVVVLPNVERWVCRVKDERGKMVLVLMIGSSVTSRKEILIGDPDRLAGFESRTYRKWRPCPQVRVSMDCPGKARFETLLVTAPTFFDDPSSAAMVWS